MVLFLFVFAVNINAECVRFYIEHGTTTQADIKERLNATYGYDRVQCFLEILMVVAQVVREHIRDDGTCAGVAMHLLCLLDKAQPGANGALPDWSRLFDDLKTVSAAVADIIRVARKKALTYMLQLMAFYLIFLLPSDLLFLPHH